MMGDTSKIITVKKKWSYYVDLLIQVSCELLTKSGIS